MTQVISLPVVNLVEFPGTFGKKIHAIVRASDLRGIQFPLGPNVRRPTKNNVVRSLLESFEGYKGTYTVESPIQLCCRSIEKVKKFGTGQIYLECDFSEIDGVYDGGHRLEAVRIANVDRATYETDNIFIEFSITAGIDEQSIKQKAIAANTSKNPSSMDLMHYKGEFDHIISAVEGSEFKWIQFYSGQPDTYDDSLCLANKIFTFPQLLDPSRTPHNIGGPDCQKHPFQLSKHKGGHVVGVSTLADQHPSSYSRHGGSGAGPRKHLNNANIRRALSDQFWLDSLGIYCDIAKTVVARHNNGSHMPYVRPCLRPKSSSKLPDGTILMAKLPSRLYTQVVLAQFRVFLHDDYTWKIPLHLFKNRLIGKVLTEMRKLLKQERFAIYSAEEIVKDIRLWDRLYSVAEEEYETQLDKYTKAA